MALEIRRAWLIHKQPFGDTSLRLTLFTRENGLFSCFFRGARSNKKKSALQAFTPLLVTLNASREQVYVNDIEEGGAGFFFAREALYCAFYVNELMYYLLAHTVPEEALFTCYETSLKVLSQAQTRDQMEIALRIFEIRLLTACGYGILFNQQADTAIPVEAKAYYQFIVEKGFSLAEKGIPGSILLAIDNADFSQKEVLNTAKYILCSAIERLLEGRCLKSRALFAKNRGIN